ncbi:hypothetical protein [Chroococcidiopsis sp. CCMEE 29]|uniref:hypothetical protein n=1 Tax=Chroococcidiopsis sp. CCMEE 29 TaxID=155894 RepID=UPI00201FB8A1|nr:hypothetical protein [Chroococcidiopsis sp. CCMEE 29]
MIDLAAVSDFALGYPVLSLFTAIPDLGLWGIVHQASAAPTPHPCSRRRGLRHPLPLSRDTSFSRPNKDSHQYRGDNQCDKPLVCTNIYLRFVRHRHQ